MEKKRTFYSEKKIYPVEVNKTFNNNNKIRLINTNTHKPYIIKRGDKIKKGTEKYIFSRSNIVNNI